MLHKQSQQVSLNKSTKTNLKKSLNKMKIIGIEEASEALLSPAFILLIHLLDHQLGVY
jgi:hypothetical protein